MIRRAAPEEVVEVRHAVLRPGRPRDTAVFGGDDAGLHWVDEHDGSIVGVATVLPAPWPGAPRAPAPGLQLRGMAVLPVVRGNGRGAALLRAIHTDLAAPLWCNARADVEGFYRSLGWLPDGDLFDIPGVGLHRRMTWTPR
ncbi:MAG: GNAT family N-acetyltransferase [Deltaproteobacteria bacterium]|nr:GNAT family N-acetyltransferase [Deltaproteobacteria bacterium]